MNFKFMDDSIKSIIDEKITPWVKYVIVSSGKVCVQKKSLNLI